MQIPIPLCRDDTYDIVDAQFCNLPTLGRSKTGICVPYELTSLEF